MRPPKGKQKLFDAAMRLFESQGYFATTVEQITLEAGVSKGLVYNYFSSKEELLAELIRTTTAGMESIAATLVPGQPIDSSLEVFIENYLAFLKREKKFLKLQLNLMLMPELQDIVGEQQQARAKILLRHVERWFKSAGVAQAGNRARIFLAMLDGIALHYLSVYKRYPLNSMKARLVLAARDLCSN